MSTEFTPSSKAEFEGRLTALLLGEITGAEAAALRQAIEADPELAALYERLKKTVALVREVAATPVEPSAAQTTPRKLSEERRQKLLAQFKTVKPKEFEIAKPSKRVVSPTVRLLELAAVLALLAVLAGLLLPSLAKSKSKATRVVILSELRQIDGAKQQWAVENHASPDAVPTFKDIQPYLGRGGETELRSYTGEKYILGRVDQSPVAVGGGAKPKVYSLDENGNANEPGNYAFHLRTKLAQADTAQNDALRRLQNRRMVENAEGSPTPKLQERSQSQVYLPSDTITSGVPNAELAPSKPSNANNLKFGTWSSEQSASQAATSPTVQLSYATRPNSAAPLPPVNPAAKADGYDLNSVTITNLVTMELNAEPKEMPLPNSTLTVAPTPPPAPVAPLVAASAPENKPEAVAPSGTASNTILSGYVDPSKIWTPGNNSSAADAPYITTNGTLADVSKATSYNLIDLEKAPYSAINTTSHGDHSSTGDELARKQSLAKRFPEKTRELEQLTKSRDVLALRSLQEGIEGIETNRNKAERDAVTDGKKMAQLDTEIYQKQRELDGLAKNGDDRKDSQKNDAALPKLAAPAPEPQPEVFTSSNAFSTFSLNVADVSFKLAAASLEKGVLPEPASIRSEEFINAFDYRDPEAPPGVPVAFAWERAHYPFAQNRDLLRFSLKTAATGRAAGRPLNIVLLLDNSGSMERADRVQIIHEALRVLAAQLQPRDTLSIVTFARTARLFVDGVPGNQAADAVEKVSGLTPQGGTNLEEAMRLAYETALRHYLANGVNRVVLLTDGAANLGNVDPAALRKNVEAHRKQGIALDCFGIGWEDYNDDLLEVLARNGDGRYGFLNSPEEAANGFARQLAGALDVAAADVKVQVEFNPRRVTVYRQIGYAKLQLTKEQFRDNTVDAAEIGAAEAGNALYVLQANPNGEGPLCTVRVRYKIPGTEEFHEHEWPVPYNGSAVALDLSSPAMRLAATASAFSEWLANSPYAAEVTPNGLLKYMSGVPETFEPDTRPKKLEWMLRQAASLSGK